MTTYPTAQCLRRVPSRSRGFGLVQVLLLIAVMAGLATIGYMQWRERSAVNSSRQERQALSQADKAIIAYATVARRLPCPDTDRDGLEDCGAGNQSGWLPTVTLALAGVDAGVDVGQLRYLVQREGGVYDLTLLTDSWRPLEYPEAAPWTFFNTRETGAGAYPADILTLTDLCQRLDAGRGTTLGATMAQLNSAPLRTTAYALAHPGNGDADGDGNLFDGANTGGNLNLMEDPGRRPLLATYNDLVLERSYASLLSAFHCRPLIDSINTVALGHDVSVAVWEMRADNIESAERALIFSTLAAVMTGLEITLAIAEGISDAGSAAVEWVACVASLGLAVNVCAAAGLHTASAALTAGVLVAQGLAVAANAVAAGIAGQALRLADGGVPQAQLCPVMDAAFYARQAEARQRAVDEAAAAQTALNNVDGEILAKQAELTAAEAARELAKTTLFDVIHAGQRTPTLDGYINTLFTATEEWGNASYAYELAQSNMDQAAAVVNRWNTEVAKYNNALTNNAATIAQLNADIAALDVQIAALDSTSVDPAVVKALKELKEDRSGKVAELALAQNTTNLTAVRDKAVVEQGKAQTALTTATGIRNTANATFNTEKTEYAAAYSALVNGAARYDLLNASNAVVGSRCTTGCLVGDPASNNISTDFNAAMSDLFGSAATVSPSTDAKMLKPVKIQKELDALGRKRTAAAQRLTDANNMVAQMPTGTGNAPCNITGSSVEPMTPDQAAAILEQVDRKGGTR